MTSGTTQKLIIAALALCGCMLLLARAADSSDIKVDILLVWATNDSKSPDPDHKPVDAALEKQLKEALPLKWSHYFQVNRKETEVGVNSSQKVSLSPKCDVEVKNLGNTMVELSLIGKGEKVVKRTQALPKGEMLMLGGNAPNKTAWLVVLKRTK